MCLGNPILCQGGVKGTVAYLKLCPIRLDINLSSLWEKRPKINIKLASLEQDLGIIVYNFKLQSYRDEIHCLTLGLLRNVSSAQIVVCMNLKTHSIFFKFCESISRVSNNLIQIRRRFNWRLILIQAVWIVTIIVNSRLRVNL